MLIDGTPFDEAPVWPVGRDGVAVVRYRINPRGALTDLSDAQIVDAIRRSFATWEAVVPSVRFVYEGTTTALAVSGDGQNVVGFGDLTSGRHLGEATVGSEDREIVEADMLLALGRASIDPAIVAQAWTWLPCGPGAEPCADEVDCTQVLPGADVVQRCNHDLQNVVTHEVGHWLYLGDLTDQRDRDMTMYGTVGADDGERFRTERKKVTLGLGDILGARALYPCDCPPPEVAQP